MFKIDKRIWYIIIAIMIFKIVANCFTNTSTALNTILIIPAVLIAITFHEFAHAYAAYKLGDDTSKSQGRLSLNPLSHIDPIGFILLLTAGIGWGKPVQINPRNFNKDISMSKAEAIVSIAGPIMNFIIAIIFAMIYGAILKFNLLNSLSAEVYYYSIIAIYYVIMINIGLGVFNLIPLPPLDGSKVLKHFLPSSAKVWFESNEQIFYIIFIIIWITGSAAAIINPIISTIASGLMELVNIVFGI